MYIVWQTYAVITKITNNKSTMTKKVARVYKKRLTASFLLPSMCQSIGLPKTNVPVIAAKNTNNISTVIGANTVSGLSARPKYYGT